MSRLIGTLIFIKKRTGQLVFVPENLSSKGEAGKCVHLDGDEAEAQHVRRTSRTFGTENRMSARSAY